MTNVICHTTIITTLKSVASEEVKARCGIQAQWDLLTSGNDEIPCRYVQGGAEEAKIDRRAEGTALPM